MLVVFPRENAAVLSHKYHGDQSSRDQQQQQKQEQQLRHLLHQRHRLLLRQRPQELPMHSV